MTGVRLGAWGLGLGGPPIHTLKPRLKPQDLKTLRRLSPPYRREAVHALIAITTRMPAVSAADIRSPSRT